MERKVKDTELVYVVRQKDTDFVKIGITTEFKKKGRFAQIQTASPTGIEILNIFYVENARKNERLLHSHFGLKRLNGEWFKLNENDLLQIDSLIIDKVELDNKWWVNYNVPLLGSHNRKPDKKRVTKTPDKFRTNFDNLW